MAAEGVAEEGRLVVGAAQAKGKQARPMEASKGGKQAQTRECCGTPCHSAVSAVSAVSAYSIPWHAANSTPRLHYGCLYAPRCITDACIHHAA